VEEQFVQQVSGTPYEPEELEEGYAKTNRIYRDLRSAKAQGLNAKEIRAWAKANELTIGIRGKINSQIIVAYLNAHR